MTSALDDYDVDVVRFWNATLSSYETFHHSDSLVQDPDQVTADLIKDLPLKPSLDASILAHEATEAKSLSNADEDQEPDASELFPIQPLTESQLPHDQTTLIPEFIENQRVLEDNITTNEEKDTYPQSAYHEYSQPYPDPSFMQPPPIPPPSTTEEAELFSNVIMSWYYAGYYTAMYQAHKQQPPK